MLISLFRATSFASSLLAEIFGIATAAKMPKMTKINTNSSIVKAFLVFVVWVVPGRSGFALNFRSGSVRVKYLPFTFDDLHTQ